MVKLSCALDAQLAAEVERELSTRQSCLWVIELVAEAAQLCGYFESEHEARQQFESLRQALSRLPRDPRLEKLAPESWQESYREHFHSARIGRFTLIPSWAKHPSGIPADTILELDPKLAFGTDHPTTRLCLLALEAFAAQRRDLGQACFIDAGSGSGILSIAALRLGFGHGRAFDIDPVAVAATLDNAERNGVHLRLACAGSDLAHGLAESQADLVFANIHHNILVAHAEKLLNAVRPGGLLLLSGCLEGDLPSLQQAFEDAVEKLAWPLASITPATTDGWGLLHIARSSAPSI